MRGRKQFSKDACTALGLPYPSTDPTSGLVHCALLAKKTRTVEWNIGSVPRFASLPRDDLWLMGMSRPQLEIVVDNQTLAEVANGTAGISNELYRAPLNRIRENLHHLFSHRFGYKGDFLDPVDWRPREFNAAADHVANCVLAHKTDFNTLNLEQLQRELGSAIGLQVFTDGGYNESLGAAAVVFNLIVEDAGKTQSKQLGVRGQLMAEAISAFHTEVAALDEALTILRQLRE